MKEYITFEAKGQYLAKTGGIDAYASDTIEYIEAHFETDWDDYDIIQAIWSNGTAVATVIDSLGNCVVPSEVLNKQSRVYVNLVASDIVNDEVVERLTSYPVEALMVNVKVPVDGSTPSKVTPSQFEQFVEVVKADADRAEEASNDAKGYAESAEESAEKAEQASANAGYMFFHIDEDGHLIYERTPNTEVDFYLDNGHLYVGAIA